MGFYYGIFMFVVSAGIGVVLLCLLTLGEHSGGNVRNNGIMNNPRSQTGSPSQLSVSSLYPHENPNATFEDPVDNKVTKLFNSFKSNLGGKFELEKVFNNDDFNIRTKELGKNFPEYYSDLVDLVYKLGKKYYCESYKNGQINNVNAKSFWDGLEKIRSTEQEVVVNLKNIWSDCTRSELICGSFSNYVNLINDNFINISKLRKDGIVSVFSDFSKTLSSNSNLNQLMNFVLSCLYTSERYLFTNVAKVLNIDIDNDVVKQPESQLRLMKILMCAPHFIHKIEQKRDKISSVYSCSGLENDDTKKLEEVVNDISNLDLIPIIFGAISNEFGFGLFRNDKLEDLKRKEITVKNSIQILIDGVKVINEESFSEKGQNYIDDIKPYLNTFLNMLSNQPFNGYIDFDPILYYCIKK